MLSRLLIIFLLLLPLPLDAGEEQPASLFPAPACGSGWQLDGKVQLFDRENLFERINGEAELYLPYGFDQLAYARYANLKEPRQGIDADIYRLGSLLDSFGIYATYRRRDDPELAIGAEGTGTSTQLFFYQDRYLVRLQATGGAEPGEVQLLACARAIAARLPPGSGRPAMLDTFLLPEVEKKSERYIAQSLLGYDFFRRGMLADARLSGEPVQLFLLSEESAASAGQLLDNYRAYLQGGGKEPQSGGKAGEAALQGVDPLYGQVLLLQRGRQLAGLVRWKDAAAARRLLEQLLSRTGE